MFCLSEFIILTSFIRMSASTSQGTCHYIDFTKCHMHREDANDGQVGQLQSWDVSLGTLNPVPEPAASPGFEWCRKRWWKTAVLWVFPCSAEHGKSRGEIQLNQAQFTQHLRAPFSILHPSTKYYRAKSQTSPDWLGSLPPPTDAGGKHSAVQQPTSTDPPHSSTPLHHPFAVWTIPSSSTWMPVCTFPSLISYLQAVPPLPYLLL